MAHREFKDPDNRRWDVWDVFPSNVDLPGGHGRRAEGETPGGAQTRFNLPLDLRQGWLAFQSGSEVRRLVPIPPNWETLSDVALGRLVLSASPIHRRHPKKEEASTASDRDSPSH